MAARTQSRRGDAIKAELAEGTGNPKEALAFKSRALQILLRTRGADDPDTKAMQEQVNELAKRKQIKNKTCFTCSLRHILIVRHKPRLRFLRKDARAMGNKV